MLTSLPDNPLAPGCFGSALTHREGSPECHGCPFADQCAPLSTQRLAALRERLGVVKGRTKKPPAPTIETPDGVELTIPRKVLDLIQRVDRAGIKVTESLLRGENPFTSTPTFLRVCCHVLLKVPGGVNRKTLTMALQRKLDWTEATASAHAGQAVHLLTALGAISEMNGLLKLKR